MYFTCIHYNYYTSLSHITLHNCENLIITECCSEGGGGGPRGGSFESFGIMGL